VKQLTNRGQSGNSDDIQTQLTQGGFVMHELGISLALIEIRNNVYSLQFFDPLVYEIFTV
jgi:hypothetical protein